MRWLTFDCFGTLVDWRHGIRTGADLVAPGHGETLLGLFPAHEAAVQVENPGMRYREVLAESLRRACTQAGVRLLDDDASVLGTGLPYWPVFPDVAAALTRVRADGWRLAILTNCDRDLIAQTQRRLPVPFDATVTAEDVGAYKPDHAHFERFRRSFEPAGGAWVHVAQSWFHDVEPARALGLPTVWVNRTAEQHDAQALGVGAVLPGLAGLSEAVARLAV